MFGPDADAEEETPPGDGGVEIDRMAVRSVGVF